MTPSELSALDLACAQALGRETQAVTWSDRLRIQDADGEWIPWSPSRDTDECTRLAGENKLVIEFRAYFVSVDDGAGCHDARYADHSGDRVAAMKVAVCRAIIASHAHKPVDI